MRTLKDQVRAWNEPSLGGTLFLRADFRKQRFDRHFHEEFAIGIIDAGCQAFVYDHGRRLDMPGGTVALIAPGVVHAGWPGVEEGWRYRMLYPNLNMVKQASQDVFGDSRLPTFHRPVVSDAPLYCGLARLHALCAQGSADPMAIDTLYLTIIRHIFERHAGHPPPDAIGISNGPAAAMREMIEDRYMEPVSLHDLATISGMSRFQALRRFKAHYGLPPHAYLRLLRVNRGLEMVRAGRPLAETAAMVGFSDQAHMTRAFRRTLGYTPGAVAAHSRQSAISFKRESSARE